MLSALRSRGALARLSAHAAPLAFLASFAFLDAVTNSRYPASEPPLWFLVPSLDVVAVLVVLVLCGAWQLRIPPAARAALVGWFLFTRLLRIADGLEMSTYYRNFNASVDLPLLPELVRLFYTTMPHARFALNGLMLLAALGLLGFMIHRALRVAETALASPRYAQAFSVLVGGLALVSPFQWQAPREEHSPFKLEEERRLLGAFGSSIVSRVGEELDFLANIRGYRADKLSGIARVQAQLGAMPLDLGKLHGQNVYLFLIESYGQTVIDRPLLWARALPEYQRFEADLSSRGFQIASRVLDSSTYGGRSWLAHATIATGVRTVDQFQYRLLSVAQPKTLARLFGDAGYRTVLVQPGTSGDAPLSDFQHFQAHYYAKDFGYRGPRFGWASMPDQFVVDVLRRRELMHPTRPLFLEYALVSSHAPWSDLSPLVEDWSALGDGSIYSTLPATHFAIDWSALAAASDAYAQSIVYDLEVLRRYIGNFVTDDSLVIILGDHQPHSEVTDHSPFAGVPVHVLSRNGALVDPFRARGYTRGMRAETAGPHPGLETFMTDFMSDFSVGHAGGAE